MARPLACVLDYGMGNLRSVAKSLEAAGAKVAVSDSRRALSRGDLLVLPGQGSFGAAAGVLKAKGLAGFVKEWIAEGRAYLGICLGLQLLFEMSEEGEGGPGLGVLGGRVKKFAFNGSTTLKVPHMGWNQVQQQATRNKQPLCPLLKDIPDESFFYFVHSYYAAPADRAVTAAETDYGGRFASMVWRERLFATQFHPEKSQAVGLRLLSNFLAL